MDPTLVSEGVSGKTRRSSRDWRWTNGESDRYEAIFAARNRGGEEAVSLMSKCLETAKSALLKHEVAFVLGQLQNAQATEVLVRVLKDPAEHPMVRHEAAEALGSVAESDDQVMGLLREYCKVEVQCVGQSCVVAMDMLETKENFEYCEALLRLNCSALGCDPFYICLLGQNNMLQNEGRPAQFRILRLRVGVRGPCRCIGQVDSASWAPRCQSSGISSPSVTAVGLQYASNPYRSTLRSTVLWSTMQTKVGGRIRSQFCSCGNRGSLIGLETPPAAEGRQTRSSASPPESCRPAMNLLRSPYLRYAHATKSGL